MRNEGKKRKREVKEERGEGKERGTSGRLIKMALENGKWERYIYIYI